MLRTNLGLALILLTAVTGRTDHGGDNGDPFQVFYLLNCRSLRGSIFRIGLFSNPCVLLGIAVLPCHTETRSPSTGCRL